jgi:hypothetical protein
LIGTHWELAELFGNLMKNPWVLDGNTLGTCRALWKLDGNTLGIAKTQNFQTPTSPIAFYMCVCVYYIRATSHPFYVFFFIRFFFVCFAFRVTIIWHTNLTHIS